MQNLPWFNPAQGPLSPPPCFQQDGQPVTLGRSQAEQMFDSAKRSAASECEVCFPYSDWLLHRANGPRLARSHSQQTRALVLKMSSKRLRSKRWGANYTPLGSLLGSWGFLGSQKWLDVKKDKLRCGGAYTVLKKNIPLLLEPHECSNASGTAQFFPSPRISHFSFCPLSFSHKVCGDNHTGAISIPPSSPPPPSNLLCILIPFL